MKLFFKLLIFISLFPLTSQAKEFNIEYNIKVGGLLIGTLLWHVELDSYQYATLIELNERGLFSELYNFKGTYKARGKIRNTILFPEEYSHLWQTKKKKREVIIFFENKKVSKMFLYPDEKEAARINYYGLINYMDPISSLLNIIINNSSSKTIDGRRIYTLVPSSNIKINMISIKNFQNIWTDHKRNDLEYIEIYQQIENSLLPSKIKIKFKGTSFVLTKN